MAKRIRYFDVAKGLLILLLLVSHYSSARRRLDVSNDLFFLFDSWQFIFRAFFMQAFFIISGYCSNFNKPFKAFFGAQVKQIMVPWICFELLSALIYTIQSRDLSMSGFFSIIFNKTWTIYWFLNALFFSKIVVWIINKVTQNHQYLIITTLFLFLLGITINQYNIGHNIFCIRESLGSAFFVAIGLVLKNNPSIYSILKKVCVYIYPIILLLLTLFSVKIPVFAAGMHVTITQVPIFLITSLTGSLACLRICELIKHSTFLEFFGIASLVVYCTHFWGLKPLVDFFYTQMNPITPMYFIPYYGLIYLSEILFCWLMVKIFRLKYLKWCTGAF